jgi:cardiolipin synthase (CMP-forming)
MKEKKMTKHLPNILTLTRILTIPIIVLCFLVGGDSYYAHIISAIIFVFAGLTDFLDGYIARTYSLQSNLGKFLDPVADKLLVSSTIMILLYLKKADIVPATLIICREILVSGLREFLAKIRISVPVSNLAKIKTAIQMVAIFLLILGSKGSGINSLDMIGSLVLWFAAILTVFTGYAYLKAGVLHIKEED